MKAHADAFSPMGLFHLVCMDYKKLGLLGASLYTCEGPLNPDPGRKCPGDTFDGIHADPEEEGVTTKRIRKKDAETSGVLKPKHGEGRRRTFPQEAKRCRRQKKEKMDWLRIGRRKKRTRIGGASQCRCGDSGGCLGGEQEQTDWPRSRKVTQGIHHWETGRAHKTRFWKLHVDTGTENDYDSEESFMCSLVRKREED
ncbi:hypothetical protein NDU88_002722 [Pleurodeles waltl]|uniref:Uncharacterized protein n=1 Tax=Pleurodeles waltl TaxID=8319 RepID=A0AAV7KTG6_PLEWA|nr:hypothetical protein NDU88_002722 [Pleurodeles waltl]